MAQLLVPPKARFVDSNGDALASGKVYFYEAGTSTPLDTYTDKAAGTANANPVILDSRGEADIWLADAAYKVVLTDSDDNTIWTVDDVKYINDDSVDTAMIADGAITTAKIADGAVTRDKLGNTLHSTGKSSVKTADYTALTTDDIILVDAISNDVTVTLPAVASSDDQILTVKRVDNTAIQTDTFVDGNVTVASDQITLTAHTFIAYQRVRLTTTGTLPAGLATGTDYYVIKIDANTVALASSRANALLGTAVDITAAAGGGTHTITSQGNTVTIDGNSSETIDGNATLTLVDQYDYFKQYCDGTEWFILGKGESDKAYVSSTNDSGTFSTTANGETDVTNATASITVNGNRKVEVSLSCETASVSYLSVSRASSTSATADVIFYRDSTKIGTQTLRLDGASATLQLSVPVSSVSMIDEPSRGTYTYKAVVSLVTGPTVEVRYANLVVREL